MGSELDTSSRICPLPPGRKKGLNWHLRPRTIFMAVGLSFILTTGLVYYWMQPGPFVIPLPEEERVLVVGTPHDVIAIDGDANFSDTALLEGWPGDGSPENPFIIDGLYIDLGGEYGNCISIANTRVSFTISNCNLTGAYEQMMGVAGAGIYLENVTNGELVNNTCNNNTFGIILSDSNSNTVANNTCNSNRDGIHLSRSNPNTGSDYNTVANNICNDDSWCGIHLITSNHSTVIDNTCNNNRIGIYLRGSDFNAVMNNTCNHNGESGIWLRDSDYSTVVNNICKNDSTSIYIFNSHHNTLANNIIGISIFEECDPEVLLLIGLVGYIEFLVVTLLVGLIVGNRLSRGK